MKQFLLFLCIVSDFCYAGNILSNWETQKCSERVNIQYRWVLTREGRKIREMRVIFDVQASHDQIVSHIRDTESVKSWNKGIKQQINLSVSDNSWISYSLFDIPWPFRQRDLVSQYCVTITSDRTLVYIKAVPDRFKEVPGINRLQNYDGRWVMYPTAEGITRVIFYAVSAEEPVLPRSVQDPVLLHLTLNSFENFIQITEHDQLA